MQNPAVRSTATFRRLALVALLAAAPALAGPGALVAGIALLAGDHHAHHLSVQRDLGHDDIVICHASPAAASAGPSLGEACNCADDHRLHLARGDRLVARSDTRSALRHANGVPAALPLAALRAEQAARVASRPAPPVQPALPAPLVQSSVLQI